MLLPLSGSSWPGGWTIAGALPLAVDRVNSDPTLLPGRNLTYTFRDSACSSSKALQGLADMVLNNDGGVDALIGPGCSVACEPTGFVTKGINRLHISDI